MDERNSQYELKSAKNGLTVPYINEVYLHSMFSPSKEAQGFAKLHAKTLKTKANVIILGLGFGYHIEEVAKVLSQNHSRYKVIVIEPNERLYRDFNAKRRFEDTNIISLHVKSIKDLFSRQDFVELLLSRPAILKHDTSYMLNKDFFTKLLTYQAPRRTKEIAKVLNEEAREHFKFDQDETLENFCESLKHKPTIDKDDFFLLAFHNLINQNPEVGVINE